MRFATLYGLPQPLPATEDVLCLWVADLARRVAHSTIRHYLYGVRSLHVDLGLADPLHGARLERVLKGVQRQQASRPKLKRMPITTSIIERIRVAYRPMTLDEACVMAAMSTATAGMLRGKEFAAVPRELDRVPLMRDLALTTNSATLRLRVSKTDPYGKGSTVRIAQPAAVKDLHLYLSMRTDLHPSNPLFALSSGAPLSLRKVMATLRLLLARAGIDAGGWRGFSFRRGGATSLAEAGVPDRLIKELGRWRSWIYSIYIETNEHQLLQAAAAM